MERAYTGNAYCSIQLCFQHDKMLFKLNYITDYTL